MPVCPICEQGTFHDPLMHWAPDTLRTVCGKFVGGVDTPHYVISKECIVPVTCPVCKEAKEA